MSHVEMLEGGKQLEVRTGEICLNVRELPDGGLVLEAMPAVEGIELVTEAESEGWIHRTRIRARAAA